MNAIKLTITGQGPELWFTLSERESTRTIATFAADRKDAEDVKRKTEYARMFQAAPDLLTALKEARSLLETASRYFPKSIKNGDRFSLLNVLANSVNPAIKKAQGEA